MPMPPIASEPAVRRVAAIVHGEDEQGTHRLLDIFARELLQRGHHVRGVVQKDADYSVLTGKRMSLLDLDSGCSYPISQDLGPGSTACCLDPAGVAAASVVLRRALAERPELVVVNRFGVLEAEGSGFAAELLALMADGVPVLTVVAPRFLAAWRAFTGDDADELPPQAEALHDWFTRVAERAR